MNKYIETYIFLGEALIVRKVIENVANNYKQHQDWQEFKKYMYAYYLHAETCCPPVLLIIRDALLPNKGRLWLC